MYALCVFEHFLIMLFTCMSNGDLLLISDLQGSETDLNATIITMEVMHKPTRSSLFMLFLSMHRSVHVILHT